MEALYPSRYGRSPPADELALDCYEGFPTFYYKKELSLPIKGIRTGKIRKRSKSWTDDMKATVRQKALERRNQNA